MKKRTQVLAIILALVMLFGCSTPQPATDAAGGSTAGQGSSTAQGGAAAGDGATAAAGAGQTTAAIKDEVVVVLKGEPSNVDPHSNSELVAMTTQIQVFDTLVTKDEQGNIVPCLAEKWEQIDDLTIRFTLRDDVYFHNGDKLTAEDVAFSINRATERPASAAHFAAFDGPKMKAIDERTVDVVTKYPYAAMFNYLASTRGQVLCKRAVEEMGDDAFGRAPVGTGAFVFDNWVTGTSITLKRNENYWGTKPAYSTLVLKFITETANRALEIEAGNADIVLDPDSTDLDRLKAIDGIEVVSGPSYGFSYLAITQTDPLLGSDVRLRKAMSLALDLDAIVPAVYGDYASPSESVLPINVFAYKSQGKHVYDPELAKQLLAEAGYPNGIDITLNLPESSEAQSIGVIAQNMWKKVGINATISTTSLSEMLAAGRRGENQVAATSANYGTGDPGHVLADFDPTSDGWMRPNDMKVKEMLDKGSSTFDFDARAAVYAEIQEYLYNQYWMITIADKNINYLITDKVTNFYCNPGNTPSFVNVVVYE